MGSPHPIFIYHLSFIFFRAAPLTEVRGVSRLSGSWVAGLISCFISYPQSPVSESAVAGPVADASQDVARRGYLMRPLSMFLLVTRFRFGSRSVPETGDAAGTVNAVIRLWVTSPHLHLSFIFGLIAAEQKLENATVFDAVSQPPRSPSDLFLFIHSSMETAEYTVTWSTMF
jgi:hypothetical protein